MNMKNKRILVCGMGVSGVAAAELLYKLGAVVTVNDMREDLQLQQPERFTICLGKEPDEIVLQHELIIISPGISLDKPFVKIARENNIPIWSDIELAYHLSHARFIAITGTNGKTTTTSLVGEIFKKFNEHSEIGGNIGVPITSILDNEYIIAEVSSYQLETTEFFRPKVSAILNITPDHLDRHKTFENYCAAKQLVFANQHADDYLVLNYDDEICRTFKANARVIYFSLYSKAADVFVCGGDIVIRQTGQTIPLNDIKLIGEHNISNVLAAIAIATCENIPLDVIRNAISNFEGVSHRLEFIRELHGVKFYNDSKATNVDSAIKALDAIKTPTILIGGGYDKQVDFYDWIKRFGNVKRLILFGDVKHKIAKQCDECGFDNYVIVETLNDAVRVAHEYSVYGDTVLLSPACASWDMFKNFEARGDLFRDLVNSLPA